MIWMLAVLAFGSLFSLAAWLLGSKQTTYLSSGLVVAFFVSALGQKIFMTLTPWLWFSFIDFGVLFFLWCMPEKRRHVAAIAFLVFASLATNIIYGVATLSGFIFTPAQNFVYGSILNGLVYLQFIAIGWGIMDDRREFKHMGILQGRSHRTLSADGHPSGVDRDKGHL